MKPTSTRKNLLFSAMAVALALLILEGAARLLPDALSGRREIVQDPNAQSAAMVSSEDVPGWDLDYPGGLVGDQPYTTNHWRMRGPEYPDEKGPGVARIIFVGDSSIFGVLLDWSDTISVGLERLREERFPGVDYQVANCAAPGHSTVQSIYKLRRQCLAFQPDLVVIGNLNSDGTHWSMSDRERFHLAAYTGPAYQLQRLASYRTLRNAFLRFQVRGEQNAALEIPQLNRPNPNADGPMRVSLEEYRANLRTLVEIARDAEAEPIFLRLPNYARMADPAALTRGSPYLDAMGEVAEDLEVPLADGDAQFRLLPADTQQSQELFADSIHPGRLGAWLLAQLLDETLGSEPP